ncbi:serine/threonine-protein kinase 31-like isoform X2 [Patiria miniata]|uniref:Uncharacterized protein n=1 Tax=Patiria miniata TaxID=46514 RepID=A0A914ADJ5_PATMI|nr:serine/threonine-protein kinase 31-like isoform X2 [Patiria miniata]
MGECELNEFLKQEFSRGGSVQSVTIKDGKNNAAKFGFVRYLKEEAQDSAVTQLNGKYIKGNVVVVQKANYKKKGNTDTNAQNGENRRQPRGNYQANGVRQQEPVDTSPEYIEQAILITYVIDACTVFGQLAHQDMAEVSAKLMMEINQYCPVAQQIGPEQPDLNKVYGALFSEDGMWYRCKVSPNLDGSGQQGSKVRVHYLDYGNDEVVDSSSLVELPMSLASLPPQAHMLVFRGIKPTAQTTEDNRKAVEFLQAATDGKSVMARLYRPLQTTSSSTPVEIYDGPSGLNDVLIQKGFVVRVLPPSPKPLLGNSPVTANASSPNTSRGSPTPGNSSAKNAGRGLLEMPPMQPDKRSPNTAKSPSYQKTGSAGATTDRQGEVQSLKKEITHLKTDKAELVKKCHESVREITKLEGEKKELQTEYQSVKEAATNTLSCLKKFEDKYETAMQTKAASLLETLAALKQIRKQVVIDPDMPDPVENAITLLTNSTDTFVSLTDGINEEAVQAAQSELSKHQAKFYLPEAKDQLDELISSRDQARQRTYEAISTFLDVVNNLPMAERRAKIESSLGELEETYQHMLDGPTDESLTGRGDGDRDQINICINYKEWKEKKSKQLKTLRETTDQLAGVWRETVRQNMLDPFDMTSDLANPSVPPLDDLAQCLIVAMETEIAMTGQDSTDLKVDPALLQKKKEEKGQETAILNNTVRVVVKQLGLELDAIDYIIRQKDSYTAARNDFEKWLQDKPDVSCLQSIQKEIKTLKSKLRHKLADKDDLEEDPDLNSGGELQKIEKELTRIRADLQRAYAEEDILLEEVSELSRVHFPELVHQYPTFDIENYLDTLGLVKRGRDLQQFDLKPLPGCNKKMIHLSQCNGKPILIKSFFIPDDAARKEFLVQTVKAMTTGCEGRLIANAVYSLSNLGEVHLLLPYIEMGSLEAAVAKEGCFAAKPLTAKELQSIFRDVLTGIDQLQELSQSTVHGAVHPRNVLLTSRSSAVLAEYDITKTPTQRAQQAYKSDNGLTFSPPEVTSGLPATPAWDMYSYGMLLLWAHCPDEQFSTLPNGTPDLSSAEMNQPLKEIICSLLSHAPEKRPNPEEVMAMDYCTKSLPTEDTDEVTEDVLEEENGNKVEVESGDPSMDEIPEVEASVPKDSNAVTSDGDLVEDKASPLETLQDEKIDTEECGKETKGATPEEREEAKTDDAGKVDEDEKTRDDAKTTPQASAPSSGSILLKKMVAAMATTGEMGKTDAAKTVDGSEI